MDHIQGVSGDGHQSNDPADDPVDDPVGPVAPAGKRRPGLRSIILAGYVLGVTVYPAPPGDPTIGGPFTVFI